MIDWEGLREGWVSADWLMVLAWLVLLLMLVGAGVWAVVEWTRWGGVE